MQAEALGSFLSLLSFNFLCPGRWLISSQSEIPCMHERSTAAESHLCFLRPF